MSTWDKYQSTAKKATRNGFGDGLLEAARKNPNVIALCADLAGSLKMDLFEKEFPERFIQVGIAEANMMGMAAGLATTGMIPFTGTFANFSTAPGLAGFSGAAFTAFLQFASANNSHMKPPTAGDASTAGLAGSPCRTLFASAILANG